MNRRRLIATAVLATLVWAPLGARIAWTAWERSDAYRNVCAERLSQAFGLPCEVKAVQRRADGAREFAGVTVWLPDRRGVALRCRNAWLQPDPGPGVAWELQIEGGVSEISRRTWLHRDFRRVLLAGLGPGFSSQTGRARFRDSEIRIELGGVDLRLSGANGVVRFEDGRAVSSARCTQLNGVTLAQQAVLDIELVPAGEAIEVRAGRLTLAQAPVVALGLDAQRGSFGGQVRYTEAGAERGGRLEGRLADIDLAEWTRAVSASGWAGRCADLAVRLDAGAERTELEFNGRLADVALGDIGRDLHQPGWTGVAELEVGAARLTAGGLERVALAGRLAGVSLSKLTGAFGWGVIAGELEVRIENLAVRDNRIVSADVVVEVVADEPEGRYIERRLLEELAQRSLGIRLPPVLPERIPYAQLGARLEIRDEQLYVFGLTGRDELLTARLLGREFPVLSAPDEPFDLSGWLAPLRQHVIGLTARATDELGDLLRPPADGGP